MSLLWLIIVNKLNFSAFLLPSMFLFLFLFFLSVSALGQGRVSYLSPSSSWTLLCISPGTRVQEFFFHLSQRQIPFAQKERIFSPGFQGWENFLFFLGNKELLHHHFHLSREPFPGPYASEGVLTLPQWVKNCVLCETCFQGNECKICNFAPMTTNH